MLFRSLPRYPADSPNASKLGRMNSATSSFLRYWSQFAPKAVPFVHPADADSPYLADFELFLLPVPVVGSLSEAEAVILMLNPGLDAEDVSWEQEPNFRSAVERKLSQSFPVGSHPLFYLDPVFNKHPGAGYWARSRGIPGRRDPQKLWSVIQAVARRDSVSVAAAQAHVARKVAIVQLAPYHSAKLRRRNALSELPSARRARAFVQELTLEKSKLIIAARSISEWGFSGPMNTERLVVYRPTLGASASLSATSEGGRALVEQLSPVAA